MDGKKIEKQSSSSIRSSFFSSVVNLLEQKGRLGLFRSSSNFFFFFCFT